MRFTQRDLKTLKKEAVARRKRRGQIRLTMEPAPKGMWYVHLETRRDGLRDWMFLLTVAGTGQRTWQARFNKAIKALADLEEVSGH